MKNVWRYLRRNHLGLIAIFLALNGVAYAAVVEKGSVDSEAVRDRSLRGVDIQTGAIHGRNINLHSVSSVLQARVKGICRTGQAIRVITQKGAVSCTSVTVKASDLDVDSVSGVLQTRVKDRCASGQAISQISAEGKVTCVATADEGKITAITPGGGLTGGGTAGNVSISTDPSVLQHRVAGACAANNAIQAVNADGSVGCNPFQVPLVNGGCTTPGNAVQAIDPSSGAVSCIPAIGSVTAGAGLSGGGGPGAVTLAADTGYLQRRVTPGCSASQAIQAVNADGTVSCLATGTGSVTSVGVAAGSGLTATANPITTSGTLGTDFATIQKRVSGSCGANEAVQTVNSDGTVTCLTAIQKRVSGKCTGNEAVQSVNADGTVGCLATLTGVTATAGSGLTASTSAGTGTLGTDFNTIQKRVSGTCAGNTAVQSVGSGGSVACSGAFTPAGAVLTSGLLEQSHGGADVTLIENSFFKLVGRCMPSAGVKMIVTANTGMNVLADSQVNGFHAVGTVAEDTVSSLASDEADKGSFEIGGTTGAAAGRTLSGGFYDFSTPAGCQFAASAIAG